MKTLHFFTMIILTFLYLFLYAPISAQATDKKKSETKRLTIEETTLFKKQVYECLFSAGIIQHIPDTLNMDIDVRIRFKKDGTLDGSPKLINDKKEASSNFTTYSDLILKRIMTCQPYKLPAEKYQDWKDTVLRISPREMKDPR